jgi:xylose isomerase
LKEIGYQGWYSLDIFPYCEDSMAAMRESLDMVKKLVTLAHKVDSSLIKDMQQKNNAVEMGGYLRRELLA